jgi:hypothetical protein
MLRNKIFFKGKKRNYPWICVKRTSNACCTIPSKQT